jgi:hypothetical protein
MKMPWNTPNDVSRELRADRPRPPTELESALEHEIANERRRERQAVPRTRLGLAAATTMLLVTAFAAAGGMAAASSTVRSAFTDVARVVHIAAPAHRATADGGSSPAADQYGRKKSCVKSAAARRAASLNAANTKLTRDLALARSHYVQSVAKANKRYTSSVKSNTDVARHAAALKAANANLRRERALAWTHHGQLVANAKKRYKNDVTKCPVE